MGRTSTTRRRTRSKTESRRRQRRQVSTPVRFQGHPFGFDLRIVASDSTASAASESLSVDGNSSERIVSAIFFACLDVFHLSHKRPRKNTRAARPAMPATTAAGITRWSRTRRRTIGEIAKRTPTTSRVMNCFRSRIKKAGIAARRNSPDANVIGHRLPVENAESTSPPAGCESASESERVSPACLADVEQPRGESRRAVDNFSTRFTEEPPHRDCSPPFQGDPSTFAGWPPPPSEDGRDEASQGRTEQEQANRYP